MRGSECSRIASDLALVSSSSFRDLVVIGRGHANIPVAFLAGFGVIRLHNRLNQNDIRVFNHFTPHSPPSVIVQAVVV